MKQTEFEKLVEPYHDRLFKTLRELVAINSVNYGDDVSEEHPFGKGVTKALNYIVDMANKDGFHAVNYANKVAEITIGEGPKNMTILAHTDVVPEGKGWPHDPFIVRELDGVLTGRGVSDDKGPLLETYYALMALRDNNMLGNYQVRFIVGGNEESGSLGVIYYFHELKKPQPTYGFSPDADWPLIYAEKGIRNFRVKGEIKIANVISMEGGLASNAVCEECRIVLDSHNEKLEQLFKQDSHTQSIKEIDDGQIEIIVRGKSAHGSTPELGENAAMISLKVLNSYEPNEKLKILVDGYSDVNGRGIDAYYEGKIMENNNTSMNLGIMKYENGVISMTINYRYPDGVDIDEAFKKMEKKSSPFKLENLGDSPLLCYEKSSILVSTLLKAYQDETGDFEHLPKAIGGGTYAKEADNIVAFGAEFPGWDSKMHGILEGSRKVDILKSMAIYARGIYYLGKKIEEK